MTDPMIVAGWIEVAPADRAAYLDGCRSVVEQARAAQGCLDFAISADLVEDGRINVYERWDNEVDLLAFRGAGPGDDQQVAMLDASVRRFEISSEGPA
ncbi:antibiotic biosynthesis monooxygenase family protein [Aeromicrobium sp.]|uniref:putative quinol monooxygenase n=1 Tax=Aeromicrobium sp. TaxID=1871063 RepID=UPI0030C435CB